MRLERSSERIVVVVAWDRVISEFRLQSLQGVDFVADSFELLGKASVVDVSKVQHYSCILV